MDQEAAQQQPTNAPATDTSNASTEKGAPPGVEASSQAPGQESLYLPRRQSSSIVRPEQNTDSQSTSLEQVPTTLEPIERPNRPMNPPPPPHYQPTFFHQVQPAPIPQVSHQQLQQHGWSRRQVQPALFFQFSHQQFQQPGRTQHQTQPVPGSYQSYNSVNSDTSQPAAQAHPTNLRPQLVPSHHGLPTYHGLPTLHGLPTHLGLPSHHGLPTHHGLPVRRVVPSNRIVPSQRVEPYPPIVPSRRIVPSQQIVPSRRIVPSQQTVLSHQILPSQPETNTTQPKPTRRTRGTQGNQATQRNQPQIQNVPPKDVFGRELPLPEQRSRQFPEALPQIVPTGSTRQPELSNQTGIQAAEAQTARLGQVLQNPPRSQRPSALHRPSTVPNDPPSQPLLLAEPFVPKPKAPEQVRVQKAEPTAYEILHVPTTASKEE